MYVCNKPILSEQKKRLKGGKATWDHGCMDEVKVDMKRKKVPSTPRNEKK